MKYKHCDKFPTNTGIYSISFGPNKFYIGSAAKTSGKYPCQNGFNHRFRCHLSKLRLNKHHSPSLQNAYNKYGVDKLIFTVIEECEPKLCIEREQYWINYFNSYKNGYNCREKAENFLGFKHSLKTKNLISNIQKEKYYKEFKKYENQVITLYLSGFSYKEIIEQLNITKTAILFILNKNNIKRRTKGDYNKQKIFCFNTKTNQINEFDSVLNCSIALKIDDRKIWQTLQQPRQRYKHWVFSKIKLTIDEFLELRYKPRKQKRWSEQAKKKKSEKMKGCLPPKRYINIKQIDKENNVIKIWNNSKELIDFFKLKNFTPILRCIKGKRNFYKGYKWDGELEICN